MEKNQFNEKQPQVLYSGSKALVLLNEKEITEEIVVPSSSSSSDDGTTSESEEETKETRTSYEYDGYWLDIESQTEEAVLAAAKQSVVSEITAYDSSLSVNSFVLNGASVWLDKATRVGLMNSTTIAKSMGSETTTLWLGEAKLEVECDKAIQLLSALEMYALECFNVTAAHKKAVSELESIEEVLGYDFTAGYPNKLNMEV